jgi:hypothetical protein
MTSDLLASTTSAASIAATDLSPEAELDQLVAALRPRLVDAVGPAEVDRLVREARAEFGQVRVTTYLPILVERRVLARMRSAATGAVVDVRGVSITA